MKDWKGKGTPRQTSKDKIERGVRKFRDNHTKQLANSLGDLEKYAPDATEEESDDISEWIALVRDRKNRLDDAWKVRTDQEAEKNKK